MRRLWWAVALLLALVAASLLNAWQAQTFSDSLTAQLTEAQQLATEGQWAESYAVTQRAYDRWQNRHTYLHIVMRHGDTDQILRAFHQVLQYLELQNLDQYAAANTDLIVQITLLAEMEQASLVNVL
jgi:hypothetical protein